MAHVEKAISFDDLLAILLDNDKDIPGFISNPEAAFPLYSDKQMDIIVLILELRFWHAKATDLMKNFRCWGEIFSARRQTHKEMLPMGDEFWLSCLKPHGDIRYLALRDKYFPGGIDDALEGFVAHFRQLAKAVNKLETRIDQLPLKNMRCLSGKLMVSIDAVVGEALYGAMPELKEKAKKWNKQTQIDAEVARLPGTTLGLTYGDDFFLDPERHRLQYEHTEEDGHSYCRGWLHSVVRISPGTPWIDWLHNTAQNVDYLEHLRPNMLTEPRLSPNTGDAIELRLPAALLPIWNHFRSMYRSIRDDYRQASLYHPRLQQHVPPC